MKRKFYNDCFCVYSDIALASIAVANKVATLHYLFLSVNGEKV